MRKVVGVAVLAGLALAGCVGVAAAQDETDPQVPVAAAPPARAPAPPTLTLVQRPNATGGEALYIVNCAMCHGPDGMGTGLLQRAGRDPAQLELRGDLAAPFVVVAARNGIGNMPPVPRGEVSDEDMQAIADYLAAGPHEVTP